jgi:hypothetical protein
VLTNAFLVYASHLAAGKVNPETLEPGWHAKPDSLDYANLIEDALRSNRIGESLRGLLPRHAFCSDLQRMLGSFEALSRKGGWEAVPSGVELRIGGQGKRVAALRRRLTASGDLIGRHQKGRDVFDSTLVEAVRRFRKRHGLEATGIVDSTTLTALNVPVEQRLGQIRANLVLARLPYAGVASKSISDRTSSENLQVFLPGFLIAILIHSLYNHFFFHPMASTLLILVILPLVMRTVFQQSEKGLRAWLHVGFDTDQELLRTMTSGNLLKTPVGVYLESLQSKFPADVVVDMLCYLRLHVELTIQAKGILLMRQAGFQVPPDPSVREKFTELHALARNIGQTGRLAILPFLHTSGRELWQLHMLSQK